MSMENLFFEWRNEYGKMNSYDSEYESEWTNKLWPITICQTSKVWHSVIKISLGHGR